MPHTPFHGPIPDDRLYCPRSDMWVQEIGDDEVRIGATAFGVFLAGEIIAFTAKPKGAEVAIGRGMGTVESRKTVIAIHAPISFVQLEGNETAEEKPSLVNRDPYCAGWMVRARPTAWDAERPHLVDAAAYRHHVLTVEPEASFVD
ncbi:MAG TPA: glycine cleavage system protein H [Rhodocyclaceae bacterium]|nr:glycine cleavage system protein H [Rhodocyclaceae bacterium]HMW77381.1 glycine cleavage system protein H [Rhodocyclaceae bacterium]HNE42513.1 glycine cleavage system protein H [Rhodocyclaceae bacterium]HNL21820.1 glycine cleavage system protein H [Rhodocyclaceae bacterium]HNM23241.1 glycine cleavage system protein H [Rhodocyclaceae bacterium]